MSGGGIFGTPMSWLAKVNIDALILGIIIACIVAVVLPARREVGMRPGTVFVPFHWGDVFGEGNALNHLTVPAFGPASCELQLTEYTGGVVAPCN